MEHPTRSQWRQAWPGESPHQSGPAPCPHPIRPQSRPGSTAGRRGGEEVRRAHRPGGPETLGIYVTANRGYQTGRIPSRTPNPQYSKEANLPIQPPPLITTTDTHNQRHGSHPTPPPRHENNQFRAPGQRTWVYFCRFERTASGSRSSSGTISGHCTLSVESAWITGQTKGTQDTCECEDGVEATANNTCQLTGKSARHKEPRCLLVLNHRHHTGLRVEAVDAWMSGGVNACIEPRHGKVTTAT